jgi:Flp pilus assembly pilin Flp
MNIDKVQLLCIPFIQVAEFQKMSYICMNNKMKGLLLLVIFAFIPHGGKALENTAVDSLSSKDSGSVLPPNVDRAYKVWIKTTIREDIYYGFLYRLNEHSITICNINPKRLDSSNINELAILTIPDTLIKKIMLRRNNQAVGAALSSLGASLLAGLVKFAVSEDEHGQDINLKREEQGAVVAFYGIIYGVVPAAIISSFRRSYQVKNKSRFIEVVDAIHRKTTYPVNPGYGANSN